MESPNASLMMVADDDSWNYEKKNGFTFIAKSSRRFMYLSANTHASHFTRFNTKLHTRAQHELNVFFCSHATSIRFFHSPIFVSLLLLVRWNLVDSCMFHGMHFFLI